MVAEASVRKVSLSLSLSYFSMSLLELKRNHILMAKFIPRRNDRSQIVMTHKILSSLKNVLWQFLQRILRMCHLL